MSTELNKKVARQLVEEILSQGNMSLVDDLLAPDFIEHEELPPGMPRSSEGFALMLTMMRRAFPDFKAKVEDIIAEADKMTIPAANALLKRMIPTVYGNEMFQSMGRDLTLRAIQQYEPEALSDENLAKVQAELDNRGEQMKPNMMATLRCRDFYAPAALVVPAILVKNDLEGTYLYIVERENGREVARKVYVTTGLTEGNRTMVVAGLVAGQNVIISGYNLVRNGLPVTVGK